MFRIAVCDDEQIIATALEQIILKYKNENLLDIDVELFVSGEDLWRQIKDGYNFDLIFLDIEMGGMNGIEISRKIREENKDEATMIIYISGKDTYVMELFEARPITFLKKPFNESEIIRNLKKCLELSAKINAFFEFTISYEKHKQIIKEILYFESSGRKIKMKTVQSEVFFYETLKNIHKKIKGKEFVQIHKSFTINYNHVISIGPKDVTMSNGEKLPISQGFSQKAKIAMVEIEKQRRR